jgi:hypothetical protein
MFDLCSCIVDVTGRGNKGKGVHSEEKGGERVVAILRFQGCSPRLCQLRTALFWPWWEALSCVLTVCRVLWSPVSRVAFVTTLSNRTSLLRVVLFTFGERMRPRAKTSSREQGLDFDIVGTCEWLSYVRASGSQAYGVLDMFFPCRLYIDSSHRDTLSYEWQLVITVIS